MNYSNILFHYKQERYLSPLSHNIVMMFPSISGYFSNNISIKQYDKSCEDQNNNALGENNTTMEELPTEKDYCSVIKKVKKDNITCENIGEIMLCQIPGVSSVSAIAILSKFKTLPIMIKSIQDDPTCLTGITTCDANGKSRKISKTTIETIVKYLS